MIVLLSVVFSEFTKLQLRPTFQGHHSNRLRVSCRTACVVAFAVMDGKAAVTDPDVDARRAYTRRDGQPRVGACQATAGRFNALANAGISGQCET
jgi:uncharacterized cupin superfamily protein